MQGFTLIELLLVSSMAGLLILSWSGLLSHQLVQLSQRASEARQQQQLRSIGFWLSHELERARDNGEWDWVWDARRSCLLYSESNGIRLSGGRLLWRGGERDCVSAGWVSLSEADNLYLVDLAVHNGVSTNGTPGSWLQLSARINHNVSTWEYRFNGPIQIR